MAKSTRHSQPDVFRAINALRVTRQGESLLRKSPRAIQEDLIDGFGTLRPSERRGLAKGLEKWLEASGLGDVPSTMLFEKPLLDAQTKVRKSAKKPRTAD